MARRTVRRVTRRARASPIRRRRTMARRRTTARRYARRAGGSMKPIIDGALAGLGGQILGNYIGAYGAPIATLGVGFIRKNNTLKTLGGVELGASLAGMIPIFGGGGSGGNGFFQS